MKDEMVDPTMLKDSPEMHTKFRVSVQMFVGSIVAALIISGYVMREYTKYEIGKTLDTEQQEEIVEIKEILIPMLEKMIETKEAQVMDQVNYFAGPDGRTDRIIKRMEERIDKLEEKGSDK